MVSLALPASTRPSRASFDIGPLTRTLVMIAASALTIASAVAILRWLTGLAPDLAQYRNLAITIHVITVLPAVPLGAYLLLSAKGTALHKLLGRIWIGLMVSTAIAITFVRGGTDFSWIHLFVPFTLYLSWKVVRTARQRDFVEHRKQIVGLYLGALVIPGAWAFSPDRLMGLWLVG